MGPDFDTIYRASVGLVWRSLRRAGVSKKLATVGLAGSLGCVFEPVEIARFETGEEDTSAPSLGGGSIDWDPIDLCEGATLVADLGTIDMEVVTVGERVHHFVIDVLPIQPPTLPAGFSASIVPRHGEVELEASGAGLRYEGPLQLGWLVRLHADEQSIVELRAQIIPESDETQGDRTLGDVMRNHKLGALTFTSMVALVGCDKSIDESGDVLVMPHSGESACESEYSPHPFLSSCPELLPNPEVGNHHPACHDGICNTLESSADTIGYAYCSIQCEDVGDCAEWDPGGSVVACVDGECTWYCDEAHPCPSELECGPPYSDPNLGECWATYGVEGSE
jgi:hypothetical protein